MVGKCDRRTPSIVLMPSVQTQSKKGFPLPLLKTELKNASFSRAARASLPVRKSEHVSRISSSPRPKIERQKIPPHVAKGARYAQFLPNLKALSQNLIVGLKTKPDSASADFQRIDEGAR